MVGTTCQFNYIRTLTYNVQVLIGIKQILISCLFVISFLSLQFSVKIYVPAYILSMHLCKR